MQTGVDAAEESSVETRESTSSADCDSPKKMMAHRSRTPQTRVLPTLVAFLVLLGLSQSADARPRPKRSSQSFEANKQFGLGIMVGVPSGLSGKYYLSEDTALDFGLGLYGRYGRDSYDRALHLHIDHLWHPFVLAKPDAFWMPLYLGVGARILDHRDDRDFLDDMHLGIRAPIGIMIDFTNVPLDIFLELALVVDVLHDGNHSYSDINLALGIRYYFE